MSITGTLQDHLAVQYTNAAQIATGIWGETATWWDTSIGYYFLSNRFMVPIIVGGGIFMTYAAFMAFFFGYNLYWCA